MSVDHIIPRVGPMNGGEDLIVVFKKLTATDKKKLSFYISDEMNIWVQRIETSQWKASNAILKLPPYPSMGKESVKTTVTICYENQTIFYSEFIYSFHIDSK